MNIYKIQSMHYAPKDSEEGIKTYLILRNKGDIGEEFDGGDAYYGITQYGWELIKENISDEQLEFLTETKIAIKA